LHHLRQKADGKANDNLGAAPPTGRKTTQRMSVMPTRHDKACKEKPGNKSMGGGSPRHSMANLLGGSSTMNTSKAQKVKYKLNKKMHSMDTRGDNVEK